MSSMPVLFRTALAAVWLAGPGGSCPAGDGAPILRYEPVVWRTDVGGPRKGVASFAQSPDGFLWLMNTETLSRFDGAGFQSLTLADLPEGHVPASLWSDSLGFCLVDMRGGVWRWQDGSFMPLMPEAAGEVRATAAVWSLPDGTSHVLERNGKRWQAQPGKAPRALPPTPPVESGSPIHWREDGDAWWSAGTGALVHCRHTDADVIPLPEDSGAVCGIAGSGGTPVWVATSRGLYRWNGNSLDAVPPPAGVPEWRIRWLEAGPAAYLWMQDGEGLRVLRGGEWAAVPDAWAADAPPVVTSVDAAGNLWYADRAGYLSARCPDGAKIVIEGISELNGGGVESLFADREGNMWAGIRRVGLVQFKRRRFHSITPADGLPAPMVWNVCEDGAGALWFAGEAPFLGRWKEGVVQVFDVKSGQIPAQSGALWRAGDGSMITGFSGKGLYRERDGEFLPEPPDFRPGNPGQFHFLYDDREGRRWIGMGGGLAMTDGKTARSFGKRDGLRGLEMRAIAEDAAGRIWVGTASGGMAWFGDGSFHAVTVAQGLPHNSVYALCGGSDGSLWVGTVGGGLARWREGRITVYSTTHGLPDNRIMQIIEDGAGSLWVGTRAGLARISLASLDAFERGESTALEVVTFDRSDGLPTREFSGGKHPPAIQSRTGALWFATTGGLASCHPAELHLNREVPQPRILSALLDGKAVEAGPARGPFAALEFGLTSLVVPPGPHSLELRWLAPSMIAGDRMRYSYRLEGVENEWSPLSFQQAAAYGTLPPGSYRLLVRACNHDGTWSLTPAVLPVQVLPYWWQRTGVRIGGGLVAALLLTVTILAVMRARHRRHLARAELHRARETERTRIARDLHDDLGSSLTEISMLATSLPGAPGDSGAMTRKLHAISGKARSLVEALDEIVWAVNPRHDNADSLATYLTGYARQFLSAAGIECSFDVAAPLPEVRLGAEPRHSLFLALKEVLNNIVRHSEATAVKLGLRAGDGFLTISVEDNGRGLPGEGAGGGNGDGLRNIQERLAGAGGNCSVESAAGAGTAVRLRLPIPRLNPAV